MRRHALFFVPRKGDGVMLDLSEASLVQALNDIREYQVGREVPLSFRPTTLLIQPWLHRAAMRILQPWRGESRRMYLAKRRRS